MLWRGRQEGEPYPALKMHKRILDRWQEQLAVRPPDPDDGVTVLLWG